jgi:chemotaxis protein CheX
MDKIEQSSIKKYITLYFKEASQYPATIETPYPKGNSPVLLDYTGIIGISGKKRGSIYLTASKSFLENLAGELLGSSDMAHEDIKDLVGEIASIICGNLRNVYGSQFMVSVPVIVEGNVINIRYPAKIHPYVFPIKWKAEQAFLSVGLD